MTIYNKSLITSFILFCFFTSLNSCSSKNRNSLHPVTTTQNEEDSITYKAQKNRNGTQLSESDFFSGIVRNSETHLNTRLPTRTEPKSLKKDLNVKVSERKPILDPLQKTTPETPTSKSSQTIAPDPETLVDDMSLKSLITAIDNQLAVFDYADLNEEVHLGHLIVTQEELRETLIEFRQLIQENLPEIELHRRIKDKFYVLPVGKGQDQKRVLFTGYYTPIIPASRERTDKYIFPIYRKPQNYPLTRLVYNEPNSNNRDNAYHLVSTEEKVFYTRRQIDGDAVLQNQNLELAWLKDDLDRYFLHIQGSGYLAYPDGSTQGVQYSGSNEFPYHSIAKEMINDGVISIGQGSMQGVKHYFHKHPEDIQKYLFQNDRYIFFHPIEGMPRGSGEGKLVGGRSIATDKRIYPAGGLAYIQTRKPILNTEGKIVGWKKFSRFVVDQDTGSAIKGPGRVDLYFGVGDHAGAAAGHYYQKGKLFYLLKK